MNKTFNIKSALLIFLFGLLGLASAAPAGARPSLDGTFTPSGQPGQMTLGPDGNVWFTLVTSSEGNEFGKIAPDGSITEYASPNGNPVTGITPGPSVVGGANDRLWMSQEKAVVKWDPVAGTGSSIPVPDLDGPRGITVGNDGFLWAVDDFGSLVRISPLGVGFDFAIPGSNGRGITASGDSLYWADFGQQQIHKSPTDNPSATVNFDVGGGPQEVAAGPDGQVAYTNQGGSPHTVGLISTQGTLTEVEVPATDPFGITFAGDGAYWVANFASDDLTRLTTNGQISAPIEFPDGSGPRFITRGANGTVWVGLESSHRIARISGVKSGNGGGNDEGGNGGIRLKLSGIKLVKGKKLTVQATLNKAATVRIALDRRKGKEFVKVRVVTRKGKKGSNAFKLARPGKRGLYRVRIVATGGLEKTPTAVRKFRVRR